VSRGDTCAMCGEPWAGSTYCPPCEEIVEELEACPDCGGKTPDPGERCPACDEIHAEHFYDTLEEEGRR
jgi:hypothetical protein